MSQLSLFGSNTKEQAHEPQKETNKPFKETFRFKKIPKPWGEPDKRGKYAYERFHEKACKIDERATAKFFDWLRVTDANLIEKVIEVGIAWEKLSVQEQADYEEAIGLR